MKKSFSALLGIFALACFQPGGGREPESGPGERSGPHQP